MLMPSPVNRLTILLAQEIANSVLHDPNYAPFLAILKGARNGAVYGTKVRFPHALVFRKKLFLVLRATRQHARNLATFAVCYKTTMLLLSRLPPLLSPLPSNPDVLTPKEGPYDTFLAGLLGGYVVFGRRMSSVSQQIVVYVFARVLLALGKLSLSHPTSPLHAFLSEPAREKVREHAWPVFASLSWGLVMYIFRWYPDSMQGSLRSSMKYIYADSDHWDSFRNLLWHNV
ncbi:MAG: hypothetical protein M1834_004414 [Cirrosporium novae-zelandiae]|nr:MAG: hypothetical protein M1834_004414 [Cirrosporium novae-zelandiae]